MKQKKEIIPQKTALELCQEVRLKNRQKHWFFNIGKIQCHFCWYFGKKAYNAGNPEKLCVFGSNDNRGCWQVNRLYDERFPNEKLIYHS
ncbi:MAG: hypothetical protein ACFFAE_09480 [Candidatus Hodarchaeota archaeon]